MSLTGSSSISIHVQPTSYFADPWKNWKLLADKGAIARAVEANVLPLLMSGRVKPVIDSTFKLANVAAAHTRMETSAHIGKIVLTV